MTNTSALIDFWRQMPASKPYVHPLDAPILQSGSVFEHGLLPQPWVGPIKTARIFVLQLNLGLAGEEVRIEAAEPDFRNALRLNLFGELPNLFLDPRFTQHPGRRWVEQRLKGVAPLATIASEIAQLELFPYHSKSLTQEASAATLSAWALNLPSARAIRSFVLHSLLPAALRGDITLVCLRSSKLWGLDTQEDRAGLIVYRGWECQNGGLTPKMRGGTAIKRRLEARL